MSPASMRTGSTVGFLTGIAVTLFDGFCLLHPGMYVPLSYPIALLLFNLVLWTFLGSAAACTCKTFAGSRPTFATRNDTRRWVFFYLLPFSLVYGILGSISVQLTIKTISRQNAFHPFLPVVFIAFLTLCSLLSKKKLHYETLLPALWSSLLVVNMTYNFNNIIFINKYKNILLETTHAIIIKNHLNIILLILIYGLIFIFIYINFNIYIKYIHIYLIAIIFVLYFSIFYYTCGGTRNLPGHSTAPTPGRMHAPATDHQKPNIILIVLDTVRADRMGLYGHVVTTSSLNQFAEDAMVFDNCIASSSWTLPSHASLFTGLYPTEHGVHLDNTAKGTSFSQPLASEFTTLAEYFSDNNYTTAAIISNTILNRHYRLDQGFQLYDEGRNIGRVWTDYPFKPILLLFCIAANLAPEYFLPCRPAPAINAACYQLLKQPEIFPAFIFLNYMDAHEPYNAPGQYSAAYQKHTFPRLERLRQLILRNISDNQPDGWDSFQRSQYDGAIAYLDHNLGELLAYLKRIGIYDSTMIIITSDHGEMFGEHQGWRGHTFTPMYEEILKVPLLVKYPYSRIKGREKKLVTLADVFASILSACDIPLQSNISGRVFSKSTAPHVAEFHNMDVGTNKPYFGDHRALYDGKYKFMFYERARKPELFDLENDPAESHNIAESLPDKTRVMQEELAGWQMEHTAKHVASKARPSPVANEALEELKALGYLH